MLERIRGFLHPIEGTAAPAAEDATILLCAFHGVIRDSSFGNPEVEQMAGVIERALAGSGFRAVLLDISGVRFDMTALLADIARALYQSLSHRDEPPFAQMLRDYDRHHALVGRKVIITNVPGEPVLSGTVTGLDSMGRLLLRGKSGVARVIAGQVRSV